MMKSWMVELQKKMIKERVRPQAKRNLKVDFLPRYTRDEIEALNCQLIKCGSFVRVENFQSFILWLDSDRTPELDYVDLILSPIQRLPTLINDTNPVYQAISKWRMGMNR